MHNHKKLVDVGKTPFNSPSHSRNSSLSSKQIMTIDPENDLPKMVLDKKIFPEQDTEQIIEQVIEQIIDTQEDKKMETQITAIN